MSESTAAVEIIADEVENAPEERPRANRARIAFVSGFLLLIVAVPLLQLGWELSHSEPVQALEVFERTPTAEGLVAYERTLEDRSIVAKWVRERWHWLSFVALNAGNQKAVVARDRTIFYRSSLDSLIAPGFMAEPDAEGHPVPAIIAFRDNLQRAGVELVLLIAPGKESIYPEWLSRRYPVAGGPPSPRDMESFLAAMEGAGVPCVYPTEPLWRGKSAGLMYLRQDTHWTPEGMALVADELARVLGDRFSGPGGLSVRPRAVERHGDLYDMLSFAPTLPPPLPAERVVTQQVVARDGAPVEPDAASPVVLLGDSFTNIYSAPAMGWGDHAGLGEHLALRLGQRLDVIALNDGGVNTARGNLARRPDALAGKQLVIWQFAARDLVVSNGDWQKIEIAVQEDETDATQ